MKRAARLTDQITTAVAASMAENKCDLAAMYNLLLSPGSAQEMVAAGVASCGIALPSLSPTKMYTEAGDLGPGLDPGTRAAQGGRRHTMGPASHPLPGLQSPPPQFTLPQINLPQNLPLVSNKPFTDFSDLRAHGPPCLRLRRVLLAGAREEAECSAAEEMAGLYCLGLFSMLLYTSLLCLGSAASAAL